jgi:hypothetical protein
VTARGERGLAAGAAWSWLQSSASGYPVYERPGFRARRILALLASPGLSARRGQPHTPSVCAAPNALDLRASLVREWAV